MKLGLTSLDLLALITELKPVLISARIENVYQLEDGSFLIKFHAKSGQENVIVDPARRINLTRFKYAIPESPSPQAATLRRHLSSGKVDGISQVGFDRIIFFDITWGEEKIRVYFELFSDGNIIIADSAGTIKYVLHPKSMRDRTIKQGVRYNPPPERGHDILSSSIVSIEEVRTQKFNAGRALTRVYNLPSEVVEEALARIKITPVKPAEEMTPDELDSFTRSARLIIDEAKSCLKPNIVASEGKNVSVLPIAFVTHSQDAKRFETFNEAVDEYFSSIRSEILESKKRSPVEEGLKNLEAILERQKLYVNELEDQKKKFGELGKLIMANMFGIQSMIEKVVLMRRSGKDWDAMLNYDYGIKVKSIDRASGMLTVALGDRDLQIDFKMPASKNAEQYFARSKEAVRKLEGLKTASKDTEEKIAKMKAGLTKISAPVMLRAMKKEWYERFRWSYSSQDFLIIGGKDSTQNEVLVKKHMGTRDIFAHADVPGGSVVIIKSEGKDIPLETKSEAVALAVAFSRAWKAGVGVADGYWVNANQVTKTPPSGEYLGKGAFMIYGERNYIRNIPLIAWFGIRLTDEGFKVLVGNEAFVKANSEYFAVLKPGELECLELNKKIREEVMLGADPKATNLIRAIPDSEITALLPSGGCSVGHLSV